MSLDEQKSHDPQVISNMFAKFFQSVFSLKISISIIIITMVTPTFPSYLHELQSKIFIKPFRHSETDVVLMVFLLHY